MKNADLKDKNREELKRLLGEKRENARKMRFDIVAKQVKNNRELRGLKRDIARILTLLNEKNVAKSGK